VGEDTYRKGRPGSLSDIVLAERLVRLEESMARLQKTLEKHIEKDGNMFYRYGWPLVQLLIWVALVVAIGKNAL